MVWQVRCLAPVEHLGLFRVIVEPGWSRKASGGIVCESVSSRPDRGDACLVQEQLEVFSRLARDKDSQFGHRTDEPSVVKKLADRHPNFATRSRSLGFN